MANLGSPFASTSSAQRLPFRRFSAPAKLTIRVDSGSSDRVLVRCHPKDDVSAAAADIFLLNGESISYEADSMTNLQDISILATSGTPNIYWGIT